MIPAGGAGTRLWPLSRSDKPKFLLPLFGERSLLQQTYDRVVPYSTPERTLIVAGAAHVVEISRQLPELPSENIIVEPCPRGTGPAIGLASLLIRSREPEALIGSFAADHVVPDEDAFGAALTTACKAAAGGWLTTIGLTPTRPETGYGYIERTDDLLVECAQGIAYRAAGFTEKPDIDRARQFLESGRYVWNASMFIWSAGQLATELSLHLPGVSRSLERIVGSWSEPDGQEVLINEWSAMPTVTIDQGVMEKSDRIAVVPVEMGWSDVGDWHGLGQLIEQDSQGNGIRGSVALHDAAGNIVWSTTDRLIALVGIENLAIVDTPDALLVLDRERAQDVRSIVDQLTGDLAEFA